MGYQIDNMEGLSVHRAPDGALVLTLISDDNFSPLQRTVLLQFTLGWRALTLRVIPGPAISAFTRVFDARRREPGIQSHTHAHAN